MVATAAVLAFAAVAAGMTAFTGWAREVWRGTPYPVADPAATARRLDGRTQALYDALGLTRAELDDDGPGDGLATGKSSCDRRGLRDLPKNISDSPPSEPGVTTVRDEWTLKGVPRAEAGPALERAGQRLTRQGWKVTRYEHSDLRLWLFLKHPDTGDTVGVEELPGDRLGITARSECARIPSGTPMNLAEEPLLPAQRAPVQLRQAAAAPGAPGGNDRR
ncbi:hypothetical protein B7P34_28950 [Streptosporangium nondiastaticum]|uniref:Uncharacterized protein n=1 Tax=Streptosporangium nondiastaticum TaxID=35764 RepID=A0A9X7JK85_9ACTN|nr:hypothetical protein B7P34_28950 [Streptosporangium nondiastaticum]